MCSLFKLDHTKFGVSKLCFLKVMERKTFGKGRVNENITGVGLPLNLGKKKLKIFILV